MFNITKHYLLMRKSGLFSCIAASLLLCVMAACTDKKHFTVQGTITGAKDAYLYLEKDALLGKVTLDSCKLPANGTFSFKAVRPQYPEFYRLRLQKGADILFAIDSCEQITITAAANTMPDFKVEGSLPSEKIRQLRLSLIALQDKVNEQLKIRTAANQEQITAIIDTAIEQHKQLARAVVLENPASIAAYYAIYQQVNGYQLFTPFDRHDLRYCGAVATMYHNNYPSSDRSQSLYNYVIQAIQANRQARNQEELGKMVQGAKVGMIDIDLPDNRGQNVKLSSLNGKVVLLDFCVYQMDNSPAYIFALRDLYNKYHAKGLEIYQLSLDEDINAWKQTAENLPWICVHSLTGTPMAVKSYNVTQIPTLFLIDKTGNLLRRGNPTDPELKKAIEKAL